jgi:hypothetical protein
LNSARDSIDRERRPTKKKCVGETEGVRKALMPGRSFRPGIANGAPYAMLLRRALGKAE